MTVEQKLKSISDRLSNGETVAEEEIQQLVNKATPEQLADVLMYCCTKGN